MGSSGKKKNMKNSGWQFTDLEVKEQVFIRSVLCQPFWNILVCSVYTIVLRIQYLRTVYCHSKLHGWRKKSIEVVSWNCCQLYHYKLCNPGQVAGFSEPAFSIGKKECVVRIRYNTQNILWLLNNILFLPTVFENTLIHPDENVWALGFESKQ